MCSDWRLKMDYQNISVLISKEKLDSRIDELAQQISHDYQGEPLKLICILKGSIIFCCELAKSQAVIL